MSKIPYNQYSGQWEQVQDPSREDIKAGFDITKTGIMLTLCQILLMRIDPKNGWKEKLLDVINNPVYSDIKLSMIGRHNILNALAAICVGIYLKVHENIIKKALSSFEGI
ncbi:MAG: hypothetical protein ACI4OX_04785, partial [Akkermansia sp.]